MISPFKAVMGGDYKEVEARLQTAIHLRFGLPALPSVALKRQIKKADTIAAYFEAVGLAGFSSEEAAKIFGRPKGHAPEDFPIEPMITIQAQDAFLRRFEYLDGNTL
jgi:5'-deoxynucleotidase YfbR-like HD superfamily hydrolase